MPDETIANAYSPVVSAYTQLYGHVDQVHPDDLELIGRQLSGRGDNILDVGCGPGHLTAHLNALGIPASGIDLVPGFIDHARSAHPDIRYDVGSVRNLGVRSGSLDGVLCWYSLIHFTPDELDSVLSNLRGALREGGVIVIGFFSGDTPEPFEHKVTAAYRWPIDELSARLSAAGFTEIERQHRAATDTVRAHAALAAIADSAG